MGIPFERACSGCGEVGRSALNVPRAPIVPCVAETQTEIEEENDVRTQQFQRTPFQRSLCQGSLFAAALAAILPALGFSASAQAQTSLSAGDLAIIGLDKNGTPADRFAFVAFVDLDPGTVIYFTDNGWGASGFRSTGGTTDGDGNENLSAIQINNTVTRGTIIQQGDLTNADFTWLTTAPVPGATSGAFVTNISLSQSGEQVYAFQNSNALNPMHNLATQTHIYVLDDTGAFEDVTDSNSGNVTPGLSVGSNTAFTLATSQPDMAFDTSVLTSGTRADWLTAIGNPSNWLLASSDNLPSGSITVVDAINPSVSSLTLLTPAPYVASTALTVEVTLTASPITSPATITVSSAAFVADIVVSISAPNLSGTAVATLINQSGAPEDFAANAAATSNATGGAASSGFTLFPTRWMVVDPAFRASAAGGTATVPLLVFNGGDLAQNVPVMFSVTAGPNVGASALLSTDSLGQVTYNYSSDGTAGLDTVSASSASAATSAQRAWWSGQRFLLSEIFTNAPSGGDNGREFIEIAGPASSSLAGYWVLGVEGDLGPDLLPQAIDGVLDHVVPLSEFLTGANGLLLVRDSTDVLDPAPDAATFVGIFDPSPDLENGGVTWILGYGNPPAIGTDLDLDNDGVFDAGVLADFTATDAIAYYVGEEGGLLYGTQFGSFGENLVQETPMGLDEQWTPDTVVRIFGPTGAPCGWAGADALGSGLGSFTYALDENTGFAALGIDNVGFLLVTPGSANQTSPAVLFQPSAQSINAGDTASFSVQAFALSFQWRRGATVLVDGGNISGATTNSLTINNASAGDAGLYTCVLTSPCGSVISDAAQLTVAGGAPCPGDYNNSGGIDLLDLLAFNGDWSANLGQNVAPGTNGDYNNSGIVDLLDLLAFNGDWSANLGQPCP